MKLYYAPGACSMASHIVANEAGLALDTEAVDLRSKRTASGLDFMTINPKGYVPLLVLDDGQLLTESAAVLQYLAERKPDNGLVPPAGTLQRYRVLEMLSYISSEIHKSLGPLIDPSATDVARAAAHSKIQLRLRLLEDTLGDGRACLCGGDTFTIADAYAFAILGGARHFGVDFSHSPQLGAYLGRLAQRPAVHRTMVEEGLIPA